MPHPVIKALSDLARNYTGAQYNYDRAPMNSFAINTTDTNLNLIPVVGDVHGNVRGLFSAISKLQHAIKYTFPVVLQTGDFNFNPYADELPTSERVKRFATKYDRSAFEYIHQDNMHDEYFAKKKGFKKLQGKFFFVRGNHEYHALYKDWEASHDGSGAITVDRKFGKILYLEDGSIVDFRFGNGASLTLGSIGGLDPSSRPKTFSIYPEMQFDLPSVDRMADSIKTGSKSLDVLLTHQGPSPTSNGSHHIDGFIELTKPKIHFHGHGHVFQGPTTIGETLSFSLNTLDRSYDPNVFNGSLCFIDVSEVGSPRVLTVNEVLALRNASL